MTKNKKRAMLISAVALIAVIIIGSTLAFFTDRDAKQNVFTFGKVSGTLTEDKSTDGKARDDGGRDYTDIKPGSVLSKIPVVGVDSTSLPAYVRVKIDYNDTLTAAQISQLEALLDIQASWHRSSDGYYYYNASVSPGSFTEPVFTKVTIPTEWGNEIAGKTFSMSLSADLIQSDNFKPTKDSSGNITGWNKSDGTAVTIESGK